MSFSLWFEAGGGAGFVDGRPEVSSAVTLASIRRKSSSHLFSNWEISRSVLLFMVRGGLGTVG